MKDIPKRHPYNNTMYEIGADFDFDLNLSFRDYIFALSYFAVIAPFSLIKFLIDKSVHFYGGSKDTVNQDVRQKRSKNHWYAFVTKYF